VAVNTTTAKGSAGRAAQNRAHAARALELLDPADPQLAWLFPAGKPPRQKALEELGRIAVTTGAAECLAAARWVSQYRPPTTHAGAAWLRVRRLDHYDRPGNPDMLRHAIHRAINQFQLSYPGTSYETIIRTLREHADEWDVERRMAVR
jgi:hypothetical protein